MPIVTKNGPRANKRAFGRGIVHVTKCIFIGGVLMLLLSACAHTASLSPKAHNGILDLTHIELGKQSVKLQGDWEFYWRQLLSYPQFQTDSPPQPTGLLDIPHSWNGQIVDGSEIKGDGYATFRLAISLNDQDKQRRLALRIPTIFHSYKLWIDGELLASVGTVGTSRASTTPSLATKLVVFEPKSGQVELIVQVANFHHMRGGITKYIELGESESLTTKTELKVAFEMFVTASLLVIGIYHLLLFVQRRKDRAPLYFGLFSVLWGIRSLLVGELLLTKWFPDFPWWLQIKIEYLVLYGGTYIFTMYFYSMFKADVPFWFRLGSRILAGVFCLIVVATPATVYSQTLLMFEVIIVLHMIYFMYTLVKLTIRRYEGAAVFLFVAIFTFMALINDFMFYNEWLLFGNFSALGLMIFTLAQMYLLSSRFTRAVTNEEKSAHQLQQANEKLMDINRNLEQIVAERTRELSETHADLQASYTQLLRSEEGRKKLLSYITHDLKAPLSSMLGYVEAVQDNVKPERNEQYLQYVHNKTIWLNRMIEDLSFLSHLETGQIPYDMRPVDLVLFLRHVYEQYELVVKDAGLRFILEGPLLGESDSKPLMVHADPQRLEQVLFNLITNALKFSTPGGTLRMSYRTYEAARPLQATISVSDQGIGIPADRLGSIFERNYKYHPQGAEKAAEGSGLGLAICREIVQAHGGDIRAESDGASGSTFHITIPLIDQDHND